MFNKVQMYLQLTTTGPSEDVRSLLTSFRELINTLISSGADLSGQAVKWNWVTFLTASFELSAVFANIKSYCAQNIIGINYSKVHYWLTKEIMQTDPSDRRREKVTERQPYCQHESSIAKHKNTPDSYVPFFIQ